MLVAAIGIPAAMIKYVAEFKKIKRSKIETNKLKFREYLYVSRNGRPDSHKS